MLRDRKLKKSTVNVRKKQNTLLFIQKVDFIISSNILVTAVNALQVS